MTMRDDTNARGETTFDGHEEKSQWKRFVLFSLFSTFPLLLSRDTIFSFSCEVSFPFLGAILQRRDDALEGITRARARDDRRASLRSTQRGAAMSGSSTILGNVFRRVKL